ncbi:TonB-dependent receptor domain-containing protein [Sphingomonas canadensis]|uniref:TonB-dependent receptor domain-containing protein n=1 Tax=Sphingomonas canadensis TaxID=1219257 RepID=A0ABW3H8X6_9SPHN|nr:TonB-dependent receptor [Sphingomonas canadensis]MCW3837140.1 TonB-dependent receptor [Sphingomonas canadensis]
MTNRLAGYLKRGAAPLAIGIALIASPAFAQDDQSAPADTASDEGEIIVTGSRIPQPNLEGVAPVTVVNSQDIKLQGTTKMEDLLNSLPAVFASQASTLSNGADGTASVDLRGLGTTRTLSLINGRRLLPGDPSPTSGSAADINIVPAAMLKRVEVLTGGASSTYGADAVAGVVNFIVDTDFTGIRVDGQYSFFQHNNRDKFLTPLLDARANAGLVGYDYPKGSVTDGGTWDATVAIGTGFDDDRGHAVAYFGYRKVKPITQRNRDYSACVLQNGGGGAPRCGGSATSDNGNVVLFDTAVTTATSTIYTFTPGGGFANTATLYNFAPTNYFQRPDERYTAGFFANYEVNESIKPYLEFMFMDDRTVAQIAPSGDFGNTLTINCDNPLMSATQRNVVCDGDNLINGYLGNFPLATGAPYNPNPGNAPLVFTDSFGTTYNQGFFQLLRRNVEGGPRRSDLQHVNFRGVIGTKGNLGPQWSYDAYYQYGRVNYTQVYSNEFSVARLNRALNVVDDPRTAAFDPICRSVLDGSDPTCVPYNVFGGAGGASAAAVAYLSATGFQKGQTSEQIASASVTGLLGDYGVKSPWADDGVAVNFGIEYRKESLELQTDNAFATGDLTGQGGATLPIAGSFKVFEFFAEAQVPIVHDSIFYDLSLTAGYRRSDYDTSAGKSYGTDTWKLGLDFAPIRDIRLRGAYNRAVRAPNIQELFATPTVGLAGSSDPCSGHTITAAEWGCRYQGLAVGTGTAANPAGQYNGLIGGNPNLTPEIATTKTLGVVLQPSMLPGFSATIDWFDIKVDQAISPAAQDAILKDCVANATSSFVPYSCTLVHRDTAGSIWLTPGGYVDGIPNNLGTTKTRGVEVSASYSTDIGSWGSLGVNMMGTYLDRYIVDNGVTQPYDCAGLYGPTCSAGGTVTSGAPLPQWRHKARLTWQAPFGLGASLQWRYVGKVTAETLSTYQALTGAFNFDPGLHIKAYNYFDLATTYSLGKNYSFRLGVNNLFDKAPPFVTSGNAGRDGSNLCPTGPCNGNTYPATYDALGRYIYMGVTIDF